MGRRRSPVGSLACRGWFVVRTFTGGLARRSGRVTTSEASPEILKTKVSTPDPSAPLDRLGLCRCAFRFKLDAAYDRYVIVPPRLHACCGQIPVHDLRFRLGLLGFDWL